MNLDQQRTFHSAIAAKHGRCIVRMDGRCAIFRLMGKAPQFVVYVRDDDAQFVLCYYAHVEDMQAAQHEHAEFKCWREQQCYRMVWQYPRTGVASKDFQRNALHYLDTAVENMLHHPLAGHKRVLSMAESAWRIKNIVRPRVEDSSEEDSVDEYKKTAPKRPCSRASSFASSRS